MPRDPDDPQSWLDKAKQDRNAALELMKVRPPLIEPAAFHVQQAVEKTIKAVLVMRREDIPFTHNIRVLMERLGPMTLSDREQQILTATTIYAVALRYPGIEPPSLDELQSSIDAMHAIIEWAEREFR